MTDTPNTLTVENIPVTSLKPHARNARTHSKEQIRQIARSIETFGWTNPVLADREGGVIAGHGRLEAAKLLNLAEVPVIRIEHMSEAQKRAYRIADNRLAELAGWDHDILAIEFGELLAMDLDFEITDTGFETAEIDLMIAGTGADEPDAAPDEPVPAIDRSVAAVTAKGDLWALGAHRLLCGNALVRADYERLMAGEQARMVFTDPPYNVPVRGHVSGLGAAVHDEFAMASGEMDEAAFIAFLETALGEMARVSLDGALHFVCMDWRHQLELLTAGRRVYTEQKNLCVWAKTNAGMGSLYRSQHELVLLFKKGHAPHINNVELGVHGRYRTNLWTFAGQNGLEADRGEALAIHPTVKPIAMVEEAIRDVSHHGEIVLDGFAGSGTTLLAAESTGRRAFALEIDPHYCDTILKRFRAATGIEPVHVASGLTFGELS
ncbi:MAG: DNA methyltransferase [Parvibaculum sp.]|uniref:site-specific DNA-methyltransferase n=1 Tax=Parvibaculum sp. TaxID=2024848 RepID=UPI0032F0735A